MASTSQARLKRDALWGSDGRHPPLHILFVHSHVAKVERCLQELERVHFTVNAEIVGTPEEFSERLRSHAYDLVVAEYPSPDWGQTQALELLHLSKRQIPLIFVGGSLQRETVAEFITRGAYDCIEMGHIGHLPVAVHRALEEKALRDERDRAQNGLRHSEARYRALTGNLSYGICRCDLDGKFLEVNEAMVKMLGYASKEELLAVNLASDLIQDPVRRAQVLGMEIKRSERTGREFALLLLDLDGLKQINDHYGHLIGNHALCRVADILSFCRDIDTAARYGGDEFAVVLPETGVEAANHVAQRICESIANDGMGPVLSVSIGVAVYPRDGEKIETLLRAADVALYSMKASKHKLLNAR